jgi:dynein heavy chain 1
LPSYTPNLLSTLSLIKRATTLSTALPLGSQLHFILLSAAAMATTIKASGVAEGLDGEVGKVDLVNNAPYESLHSVMHWGVTPWFEAYVSSKTDGSVVDGLGSKKGGEAQTGE